MASKRTIIGIGMGAVAAAGFAMSALNAEESRDQVASTVLPSPSVLDRDSFTPAAADPELAALLKRSGSIGNRTAQFTPSESASGISQPVRAAARAATAPVRMTEEAAAKPAVTVAPIDYSLGVSVGWKRAAANSVPPVEVKSSGADRVDLGIRYDRSDDRPSRVRATGGPDSGSTKLVGASPDYSIDVGGAYSVTRNLDVTAGIRYEAEDDRDRLPTSLTEDRRDSQAVYIGTAFRF